MRLSVHLLAFAVLVVGCGPVNDKPADSTTAAVAGCAATTGATALQGVVVSHDKQFAVLSRIRQPDGSADDKPQQGENAYVFRVFDHKDLLPIDDAQVTIEYQKTDGGGAHGVHVLHADVTHQDNGTYTATLNFKRHGQYEIRLVLKRGETEERHVLSAQI